MRRRRVVILGATGSIGQSARKVARDLPERMEIVGMSAHSQADALREAGKEFPDAKLAVSSGRGGEERLVELATMPEADMVLIAIVGTGGLRPALAAIEAGKDIAVASKEILVMAGEAVMEAARYPGVQDFPGFKLVFTPSQAEASLMCQAMAGMWKDVLGIDNVEIVPAPEDWRTQIKTQPFDMYIGRWYGDYEDPQDWHNLAIVEDSFSTHYTKKEWVDAVNAAKSELDPAKRKQEYEAAEVALIEDTAIIPLTWPLEVWVFKPNVKGLIPRRLIGYPNYRGATVEASS